MNYDTLPNPNVDPAGALDFVFDMAKELTGELEANDRERVIVWLSKVRAWRNTKRPVTCSVCGGIGHRADHAIHTGEKP